MASRIIRTDNPDPNSWIKKFWRNEQETKGQEPSDEDRREYDLRNAEVCASSANDTADALIAELKKQK